MVQFVCKKCNHYASNFLLGYLLNIKALIDLVSLHFIILVIAPEKYQFTMRFCSVLKQYSTMLRLMNRTDSIRFRQMESIRKMKSLPK